MPAPHIILWIIGILVILFLIYIYLIFPRKIHKPDYSVLMNHHYAHRGLFDNSSDAPENSLAAFALAVKNGYGIELDVQLTKDNQLVVFHDAKLKRMCKVSGNVWDYTLEELQQFHLADSNETIPLFKDVLDLVNRQVPLIIEYKLDRPNTIVCELSEELLANYNGIYCIECFHPKAVHWYRKNHPDVIRGQLCEEFFRNPKFKSPVFVVASFLLANVYGRPDFIAYNCLHKNNISRRLCRHLGALSIAWTVKSQEQYNEIKNDFDLFIFDNCKL